MPYPKLLRDRPTKTVPFDIPLTFAMGPSALKRLAESNSLEEILTSVVSLEPAAVKKRLSRTKEGELDHILLLFNGNEIPTRLASIEGFIASLTCGY
jgi:hypothetical protein